MHTKTDMEALRKFLKEKDNNVSSFPSRIYLCSNQSCKIHTEDHTDNCLFYAGDGEHSLNSQCFVLVLSFGCSICCLQDFLLSII